MEKKLQWCTDSGIYSEVTKYESSQFVMNVEKFLFQKEAIQQSGEAEIEKTRALHKKATDELNNVRLIISKFRISNRYCEILFLEE